MVKEPWYIVDVFRDIVETISANLTPGFQEIDPNITGVHYHHGHPMEIIETMKQLDDSPAYRFDKYPLVALFQDFPERVGAQAVGIGFESEVSLHIIIACATRPTYKAPERYEFNFKPFLYPIYRELMQGIHDHRALLTYGQSIIAHTKYDRLYWGREGLYGNEANTFNDWLDCIEIQDLTLKVNMIC